MTASGRRVQSGSPWEDSIGFARAVEVGDRVLVAGTTSFKGTVLYGEGDPYEQAKVAFANALEAIGAFGLGPGEVVRTRMYLTHTRDVDGAGRAHREIFNAVRPVSTLVVVSGFVDPRILVEVELEAVRGAQDAAHQDPRNATRKAPGPQGTAGATPQAASGGAAPAAPPAAPPGEVAS